MTKVTYDNTIASIILNGEQLNPFPLRSAMRKGCPLFPLLLNILLGFLTTAIR
jgi:hypothetical protein